MCNNIATFEIKCIRNQSSVNVKPTMAQIPGTGIYVQVIQESMTSSIANHFEKPSLMLNKMCGHWNRQKAFSGGVCSPQKHSDHGQENCNFIFCNSNSAELSITLCVVMELVWFYILYYIQHAAIEFHKEKSLCLPWHQGLNTVCRLLMPKTPALSNSQSNWT